MYHGIVPLIKIRQKISGFSRFGVLSGFPEKHSTFLSGGNENKITALLKHT
jgi:hypothetical protein